MKKILLPGIVFSFVMIFSNIIPVKAEIAYDDSMAAVLEDQKMVIRRTSGTDEGNLRKQCRLPIMCLPKICMLFIQIYQ